MWHSGVGHIVQSGILGYSMVGGRGDIRRCGMK